MRRSLILSAALLSALPSSLPAVDWPEPGPATRPWTRWWWLGNIVDEAEFTYSMEHYKAAGLGGLEITPVYGVRGREARFTPYLSPRWVDAFTHVLAEGRRLGLGVDLATGTGWPFGGPWIGPAEASRYQALAEWRLTPGSRLEERVALVQKPTLRHAGALKTPLEQLPDPVSSAPDPQSLAVDQVRFPVPLPPACLMAYGPAGECLDLGRHLGPDGTLDWTAPASTKAGDWHLVALFAGWHGKQVERAGPGGEGNVIDHFSKAALDTYLGRFDKALAGRDLSGLRAWFNDSYEVDDANGQADYTPAFLDEFARRRGYDLRTRLHLLLPGASGEEADRALCDYRETLSDLLLDQFTRPWRSWAAAKGHLVRNQAHGSPANILDLYLASDIPEQEGTDILSFKLPASAAHFKGTTLVSSEAGTWLNEHWQGTLAELRAEVDRFLLGGVNHNCYHGTAFSPRDEPWPGFQFYASVELSPANPLWRDFHALNAYVTRAQSILQAGAPDEQLLLYHGLHDRWSLRGSGALPHFHGRANEQMDAFRTAAGELLDAGFGWDAVSDQMLQSLSVKGGLLTAPSGASWRALVLPSVRLMPLPTLRHLAALVRGGAVVVLGGAAPSDVPGLGQLDARRAEFARLAAELFSQSEKRPGGGRVLSGSSLPVLAAQAGALRESLPSQGLRFVRRLLPEGPAYFIVNASGRDFSGWVRLAASSSHPTVLDPLTGLVARPPARRSAAGGTEVFLQLSNPGSVVVADSARPAEVTTDLWQASGPPAPLAADAWSMVPLSGGPVLPAPTIGRDLRPWNLYPGEHYSDFSGTGRYAATFARPAGPAPEAWRLDLGAVAETSRILLNGRLLATCFGPPHCVILAGSELEEVNTLIVEVSSTAANRIAELDRRDPSWKRFYNINMAAHLRENRGADGLFTAAHWKPRDSGLVGPVTLTPLARLKP